MAYRVDIRPLLASELPNTVSVQRVTKDRTGGFSPTPGEDPFNITCRIKKIKGEAVLSKGGTDIPITAELLTFYVDEVFRIDGHLFTLPAEFDPRVDLKPIEVAPVFDGQILHHQVVFF